MIARPVHVPLTEHDVWAKPRGKSEHPLHTARYVTTKVVGNADQMSKYLLENEFVSRSVNEASRASATETTQPMVPRHYVGRHR